MIEIIADDVRFVPCDMLILKYAQGFHGADALVAETLRLPAKTRMPRPSEFIVIESHGSVSATRVLFFGVVPPNYLEYREIREFTRSALKAVSKLFQGFSSARRVAMTIHGVGYGLDEREAFLAQLGGIADALHGTSSELHISIVERDAERADRLREILNESWSPQPSEHVAVSKQGGLYPPIRAITAGDASRSKPHIFVAMPFGKALKMYTASGSRIRSIKLVIYANEST